MDVIDRQRQHLCTLLDSLSREQWDADTMCDGWDAGDMVAHLLVREREPVAALGILIPPLSTLTDKRMAKRKSAGRTAVMADLRQGPPAWMRLPVARDVQVGEDWIHAADIARGGAATLDGANIQPFDGTEDPEVAVLLWKAVGRFAPLTLRSIDTPGVIALTDGTTTRSYRVGGAMARIAPDEPADVTITGPVGELVLYLTGRRVANVSIDGKDALRVALEGSTRGV